jgi:hypothetical protein
MGGIPNGQAEYTVYMQRRHKHDATESMPTCCMAVRMPSIHTHIFSLSTAVNSRITFPTSSIKNDAEREKETLSQLITFDELPKNKKYELYHL